MAKKLILVCLMLSKFGFLEAASPKLKTRSPFRPVASREQSPVDSPIADVYVRMGGHGDQTVTINAEANRDSKGWRACLPTKNSFDRFLYLSACVGLGVGIGITISTCSGMQEACREAKNDLDPLVSNVRVMANDFSIVKNAFCEMFKCASSSLRGGR